MHTRTVIVFTNPVAADMWNNPLLYMVVICAVTVSTILGACLITLFKIPNKYTGYWITAFLVIGVIAAYQAVVRLHLI